MYIYVNKSCFLRPTGGCETQFIGQMAISVCSVLVTICSVFSDEIDEEDEKVDWILDTIKNTKGLEKYMPNGDQEEFVSCLP